MTIRNAEIKRTTLIEMKDGTYRTWYTIKMTTGFWFWKKTRELNVWDVNGQWHYYPLGRKMSPEWQKLVNGLVAGGCE